MILRDGRGKQENVLPDWSSVPWPLSSPSSNAPPPPHSQATQPVPDLSNTYTSPSLSFILSPHTNQSRFLSLCSVISAKFVEACISLAKSRQQAKSQEQAQHFFYNDFTPSSTTTASAFSSPSLGGEATSSATSNTPNPYAVSLAEAQLYYAGLPSDPVLIYWTGKPWFPPRGPEVQRHLKELHGVFSHAITKVWDILGWDVVKVMEAHKVS